MIDNIKCSNVRSLPNTYLLILSILKPFNIFSICVLNKVFIEFLLAILKLSLINVIIPSINKLEELDDNTIRYIFKILLLFISSKNCKIDRVVFS